MIRMSAPVNTASNAAGSNPGEVHAATVVLDDEEDVEAPQEHGVDVGEVDGEDRVGLRGQELAPGRPGPPGRGIEPGVLHDSPHGRSGDGTAKAGQLALYPSIAPAGILPGHPQQHQVPDRRCDGWTAWSSMRVGPATNDELAMPTAPCAVRPAAAAAAARATVCSGR